MKTVLLTGGAGFIGSHTCLSLLESGYEVIVVDSLINSSAKSLEKILEIFSTRKKYIKDKLHFYNFDLRNTEALNEIFSEFIARGKSIQNVIHFAGLKAVGESIDNPLDYWDTNINATISLLDAMQRFNCRTIVFSSSATIYGLYNNNSPIKENSPIHPINPYGTTKASIEQLLYEIFQSSPSDWRVSNLRYFNPIGAHFSGLIGEDPSGVPNNIFPYICQVASGKLKQLKIFGNDWPTPDGTGVRDYIHVMDLAEGHVKALNYLNNELSKFINLNLGTGKGTSVLELINAYQEASKKDIPYVFTNRRKGDTSSLIADNNLAKSTLKWSPKRSLFDMCRDGWKWQSLNPNGYK